MPRFTQLSDWLAWLETLHPQAIDLGLQRVYEVAKKLQLLDPPTESSHAYSGPLAIPNSEVFMVAGTNGKGSCVKTIEQALLTQAYRVGSYTSPHIHHYCERIQIDGEPVAESLVCDAFYAIDIARGNTSLTYFEFGTLAALWIFVEQQIPFVVLEVGLGGRLDAVNIVDATIAIITSIAVDHEEWLGNDREIIAIEKLGITRTSAPVVIAENSLTDTLIQFAHTHTVTSTIHKDFFVEQIDQKTWRWQPEIQVSSRRLPLPDLPLNSVAAGLQALYVCNRLPSLEQFTSVLSQITLSGRFECVNFQGRQLIFDVAHNAAAATLLANKLAATNANVGKTLAVFAVMADKDIHEIVRCLSACVSDWYIGDLLMNTRAASSANIGKILLSQQQSLHCFESIEAACSAALSDSTENDRIVVFGSFYTVAAIQQHIKMRLN
jgi:dihydrofolate synthase / folylpolyglutamate synthase